jgi:16S rRNA processing protein RimM
VSAESDRVVQLGQISGVHGVQGWVKILSFTEPRSNLLDYRVWQLTLDGVSREAHVESAQVSGKRLIAKIAGVDDRNAAAEWIGAMIEVPRSAMPPLQSGEYYWTDLEGLAVTNLAGQRLGTVSRVMATGANDVLVLDGSAGLMIPFVANSIVQRVDLDAGEIVVDWDESFWE